MTEATLESIAVIDDEVDLGGALSTVLRDHGYGVILFARAEEFLAWLDAGLGTCDLIVSDITMPGMGGFELCHKIRARPTEERIPIILLTGTEAPEEKAKGLEAGADDFLHKPFRSRELLAKIRSLLEIRAQEIVNLAELAQLRDRASNLEAHLAREARRSNRLGELRRFVSPKVADALTSDSRESVLNPHRAEVTVMFADLRRFTSFAETADPGIVLSILGNYYRAVGEAALRHKGSVGHLAGDGIMIFLNDPEPIANHPRVGLLMALEARDRLVEQRDAWKSSGFNLDFGIGLAEGPASIGGLGFERFWHYSVIGPVTNLAARLCSAADGGQILVSHRFLSTAGLDAFEARELGNLALKGLRDAVRVLSVLAPAGATPLNPSSGAPADG